VQSGLPLPTHVPESLPLVGVFYYEAESSYPQYTLKSPMVMDNIDFSVTPSLQSTLPISMICPWGHPISDYLKIPSRKQKQNDRFIAYFNEHGVAKEYDSFIQDFFRAAENGGNPVHAFQHMKTRDLPEEATGQLENRLKFLSTYKFVLVTEAIVEKDWVEPEFSHAILAGAVPIYIGAPNIFSFVPGPRSIIHARDFESGEELWNYVKTFQADDEAVWKRYLEFHEWRSYAFNIYLQDDTIRGDTFTLGTGQGVSLHLLPSAEREQIIHRWAAVPFLDGNNRKVLSLDELKEHTITEVGERGDLLFQRHAEAIWRSFRNHLDHCVHYAECRICELVNLLT
jgi:Glycosyltransferase family 10 (fucosyltransferase) C-term